MQIASIIYVTRVFFRHGFVHALVATITVPWWNLVRHCIFLRIDFVRVANGVDTRHFCCFCFLGVICVVQRMCPFLKVAIMSIGWFYLQNHTGKMEDGRVEAMGKYDEISIFVFFSWGTQLNLFFLFSPYKNCLLLFWGFFGWNISHSCCKCWCLGGS